MKNVNFNIRELRKILNVTESQLAMIFGVSYRKLRLIENGDENICSRELLRLAQACPDLDLNWLIRSEGSAFPEGKTAVVKPELIAGISLQDMVQVAPEPEDQGYEEALRTFRKTKLDRECFFGSTYNFGYYFTAQVDDESYLIVRENECKQAMVSVIKERLWVAPEILLRRFLHGSDEMEDIIEKAEFYRTHYSIYSDLSFLNRFPHLKRFNAYIESELSDKDKFLTELFKRCTPKRILSIDNGYSEYRLTMDDQIYIIYNITPRCWKQ